MALELYEIVGAEGVGYIEFEGKRWPLDPEKLSDKDASWLSKKCTYLRLKEAPQLAPAATADLLRAAGYEKVVVHQADAPQVSAVAAPKTPRTAKKDAPRASN